MAEVAGADDSEGHTEYGGLLLLTPLLPASGALALLQDTQLWPADALPHTLHAINLSKAEHKSVEYLLLNPAGVVPTLMIDTKPITEAAAICLHLADSFKGSRLAPVPGTVERARYYQWMFFCANTLQPAYRTWFYPSEVAGQANAEAAKAAK